MFDSIIQKLRDLIFSVPDAILAFFNTEFWGLIGWTALIAIAAGLLAWAFGVLRPLAGAIWIGLAAMWYGYHMGQKSQEKEVERIKKEAAKAKAAKTVKVEKKEWGWQ
jgi:hypothetical protein